MAYGNPSAPLNKDHYPRLVRQAVSEQTNRVWAMEGTDPVATVQVTGYITNGKDLGMKVGDRVEYLDTNLNITSSLVVESVNATTGAVDLGDGTTIGSTTNSD